MFATSVGIFIDRLR